MRVLVVCQYYYPENFQITPICEQLVLDGYEVTVLTGLPNYPLGIIPKEYRSKKRREEIINGVHVIRCTEIGRRKGVVFLAFNYISFLFSSMKKVRELSRDFDVVLTYQLSPILMGYPGRWYAKRYKKPQILYCCDLWPESIKLYIKSEKNILFKIVNKISRTIYNSADFVAVQSSSFKAYLNKVNCVPFEKMEYMPAFASEEYLREDYSTRYDEYINYVFLGNIGIAQDLSSVLEAFYIAIGKTHKIRLHIVGDGVCLANIKAKAKELNMGDSVVFYGRRPVSEMAQFYHLADACLVTLKGDSVIGHTLPSKVQGYMAAGKPIIGMIDGSAQEIIKEAKCGICVSAGDINGLSETFCNFAENIEKYVALGENGRKYFKKNFSKKIFMQRLENKIDKMFEDGRSHK